MYRIYGFVRSAQFKIIITFSSLPTYRKKGKKEILKNFQCISRQKAANKNPKPQPSLKFNPKRAARLLQLTLNKISSWYSARGFRFSDKKKPL